jgi:hypothetical protein
MSAQAFARKTGSRFDEADEPSDPAAQWTGILRPFQPMSSAQPRVSGTGKKPAAFGGPSISRNA